MGHTSLVIDSDQASSVENRATGALPPAVYLAGPFTSHTKLLPVGSDDQATYVIDADSNWRRALLAADAALSRMGWLVFLPHRDVSKWGMRNIAPGQVVRECVDAVCRSNLVIALLAESFGTHVEVGVAIGRQIPTIVIKCGEQSESYFGGGIADSALTAELFVPKVDALADCLDGPDFSQALTVARQRARQSGSNYPVDLSARQR